MNLFERITKYQWVILTVSLVAVLALVGMNLAILSELREQRVESERESQRIKLDEFANQIRYEIIQPLLPLWRQDLEELQRDFPLEKRFPDSTAVIIEKAARDPLFSGIYFTEVDEDPCTLPESRTYLFNSGLGRFQSLERVPQEVCDAVLLSKSRGRVFVEGSDTYRWNAKISFDTHRSFTLAFLDVQHRHVIGHLTFAYDPAALVDSLIAPRLAQSFGEESGGRMIVWLRDWTNSRILASSDPSIAYNRELYPIDLRQEFPDFLDYWSLHASFVGAPELAGLNDSYSKNLYILLASMFVLVVGIGTMFVAARRERWVSNRQSEFLANVTHELKTPLAVLQAAGENLSDRRVENVDRVAAYGVHIHKESTRLRSMIDRLLDVAKSEGGQLRTHPSACDARKILEEYVHSQEQLFTELGVKIELDFLAVEESGRTAQNGAALGGAGSAAQNAATLGGSALGGSVSAGSTPKSNSNVIYADPEQVRTVLSNLVDNSIKYSADEKHITITCRPEKGWVHISVKDTGVGIPKRAQKQIFEKFYRVEHTLTATTKGHGLGLSIVKDLVTLNNGKIRVESTPGAGSTFTISFRQINSKTKPENLQNLHTNTTDGVGADSKNSILISSGSRGEKARRASYSGRAADVVQSSESLNS